MEIQITATKAEGAERRLQVAVPAARVAEARNKAAARVSKQVRIPGFRPGKAPAAMVKKQYAQAIDQEAVDQLLREAFEAVLAQEKLDLATQPHAHDVKFGEDESLSFELHCEVRPTIELAKLEGFRVMRPKSDVTDAMVQEQLDRLLEQRATWTPVEGKPAEGDLVTVTLATAEEDGTIPEGREYRLVMGAGQAITGIEELVLSMSIGETKEQPVKWPEDFPDESQRGKTKPVRATLTEIKKKSVPALDDAFAAEMGDFASLAALKETIEKDLAENLVREADAAARTQLLDEIVTANPFDLPPSWVKQMIQAYAEAYRIPQEEILKFGDEIKGMAERQVRRDLIIDTLAEKHALVATEADVDAKVAEVAGKRGEDVGKTYAALQKAGRLRELERSITEERVFAWLLERNTIEQA
ncbi:trigger factor [Pseudogemmatithrix spongiicola]|uniref:Trigger factor n=1 Tax=Pseudogemmatithrix spongiicola TaxID=3062599 RepID=A0AA49JVH9_9BACT|nr:trigger factor [Gemmatimonadaceae bacterium 'strain 138']WKW15688.1 trigger factor [Gemmatimonadaceae bacterium 'strain 318']